VAGRTGGATNGTWSHRVRAILAAMSAATMALGLALGAPAAAQQYSDGYKFLKAVDEKDGTLVTEMLDAPGSTVVNARDITNGRTALHIAVERRDTTWINFLAGRGANPNLADNHGLTPLMRATQLGYHDGIEALVRAGARVDEPNDAGETPLMSAVHRRDVPLMRVLLEAGADPDRRDNSGRSARDYAGLEGRQSATLAEIDRHAEAGERRAAAGEAYGPSL